MIKVIAAISKNRVIGKNNQIIWHIPEDLKRFKRLTRNDCIIMGRKTYDSIGQPLSERRNIIITRDKNLEIEGCETANSLSKALSMCHDDCYIIGGGEIYKQALPIADELYLTVIDEVYDGDVYFPEISTDWMKLSEIKKESNGLKYSFINYLKK